MKLRKTNAVISLIIAAMLIEHAITYSIWMLTRCSIERPSLNTSWLMMILMVVHGVLSMISLHRGRRGTERSGSKGYRKQNISTYIQRVTGITMLLLIAFHVYGALTHFTPVIMHAVIHPIFFAAALAHNAISLSKAMITLGIGNAKVVRTVDIVMKILSIVCFIAGVVGFNMCLFIGVAR